jgi:hypothetical protein
VKEAQEHGVTPENGWKLAMIVREPLERFVSGFIYVCVKWVHAEIFKTPFL